MGTPKISFIATKSQIAVKIGDELVHITSDNDNFAKVLKALRSGDGKTVLNLINPLRTIKGIKVVGGHATYNGRQLHGALNDTIVRMAQQKKDFKYLLAFVDKLEKNPSVDAQNDLYGFVEANKIQITPDGDLLLFKVVRNDFMDVYTGNFDNSPGKSVSIDRSRVDADNTQTCSYGLHVCAFSYIQHYGNSDSQIVQVRVNPADFVAVPRDYNNAKARVCGYFVTKALGLKYEVKEENVNKKVVADLTRDELITALLLKNGSNRSLLIKTATSRLKKMYDRQFATA